MTYYNSVVVLRPDKLYKATIRYSYLYLFGSEESETFKTLGEANAWILSKRCPNHVEILNEDDQQEEEDESPEIEGNAFENDSDSEEDTEQKRNERLNIEYNREKVLDDIKKKKPTIVNYRKPKKWNVSFKN